LPSEVPIPPVQDGVGVLPDLAAVELDPARAMSLRYRAASSGYAIWVM
jgi:hypothetical protein